MPVQIEMAKPADLAGEYLKGVQTQAQIKSEQDQIAARERDNAARLQQDAMRLQQESQRAQAEMQVQQQRINVAASYNQQKAALRKQQLDQVAAVNAQKTKEAARQFSARQMWETGLKQIDDDKTLTDEQKQAKKSQFIMRVGPMTGIAGTEVASMVNATRPAKPTVPASVTDKGDFYQVTQPNGSISVHAKPKAPTAHDPSVKVQLSDEGVPTAMPRSQAMQVIPGLPKELQTNAVNAAVMAGDVPRGTSAYKTAEDVKKAYQGGKLTREQAKKILMEQFGHQ